MSKNYSWKKTLWKGVKMALTYGIPYVIFYLTNYHPEVMTLTVGSILVMAQNYFKNKNK